jgi:RNA polymerase sigma-32 factor
MNNVINSSLALNKNSSFSSISYPLGLGDIESYIKAVNQIPMLTFEEEKDLSFKLREHGDIKAAERMVLSHLRLVVSTARGLKGYGLQNADLIQEGNIGLMKAVKRFDERTGYRLVTYAMPWIKSEMQEYIIKNTRITKIATTKAHRKLFFNLRSFKKDTTPMSVTDIQELSNKLNVSTADVIEMEVRLTGGEISLDNTSEDGDDKYSPISYLSTNDSEPTQVMALNRVYRLQSEGIEKALETLDDRSRRIIESRWLAEADETAITLQTLADEFGVSAERIRQIEVKAMTKMKQTLSAYI